MVRKDYPDVMLAIDSISGMVGDKLLPSEIGCDAIFASTQKCFALPPGLAVGIVSDRALQRAREVPNRGMYTNLTSISIISRKASDTIHSKYPTSVCP